jgi:hypothetical protein
MSLQSRIDTCPLLGGSLPRDLWRLVFSGDLRDPDRLRFSNCPPDLRPGLSFVVKQHGRSLKKRTLEVWTVTIMMKVPPLSEAAQLSKTSEDVYDHDSDEGWLHEVELHEVSLRSPPRTPNSSLS